MVNGKLVEKNTNPFIQRLERQAHRLKSLAQMIAAVPPDDSTSHCEWKRRIEEQIRGTVRAIKENICELDPNEIDLLLFMASHTFRNGSSRHLTCSLNKRKMSCLGWELRQWCTDEV